MCMCFDGECNCKSKADKAWVTSKVNLLKNIDKNNCSIVGYRRLINSYIDSVTKDCDEKTYREIIKTVSKGINYKLKSFKINSYINDNCSK